MPDRPSQVVTYRKAHLTVAEVLFDETFANAVDVDLVRYRFRGKPVPDSQSVKCYTLWLNLENSPKCLLANMSRTTRSQIRRAQREGFRYEFSSTPTRNWTEQFFDFYDSFARSKNLKPSVDRHRLGGFPVKVRWTFRAFPPPMGASLFGTRTSEAGDTHLACIRHLYFAVRPNT
jgi:hypothetical protein